MSPFLLQDDHLETRLREAIGAVHKAMTYRDSLSVQRCNYPDSVSERDYDLALRAHALAMATYRHALYVAQIGAGR